MDHPESGGVPRHPATRARRDEVEGAERALPIAEMVDAAADAGAAEDFKYPAVLKYPAAQQVSADHT